MTTPGGGAPNITGQASVNDRYELLSNPGEPGKADSFFNHELDAAPQMQARNSIISSGGVTVGNQSLFPRDQRLSALKPNDEPN